MDTPMSLFRDGKLQEAIDLQLTQVKKNPKDTEARFFLAELAAFEGDWERVDRQLDSILTQLDHMPMLPLLVRQLVRAEVSREEVLDKGRAPEIIVPLDETCASQIAFCAAFRTGAFEEAAAILNANSDAPVRVKGTCDGASFETLVDLDDRLRGVAEVLTATGKYFWIPWHAIASLKFTPPKRPLDLIWRKAEISVRDRLDGEVYIPARYPKGKDWSELDKLSRTTNWHEHPEGIYTGTGQRELQFDEEPKSILEVTEIACEVERNSFR